MLEFFKRVFAIVDVKIEVLVVKESWVFDLVKNFKILDETISFFTNINKVMRSTDVAISFD
jgi:hypothetical protein